MKNEHSRRSSRNPLSTMISLLLDHARRSAIALPFSLQQRVLRMLGSPPVIQDFSHKRKDNMQKGQ